MKHILAIAIVLFGFGISLSAQNKINKSDFDTVCDSLAVLISEHSGVEGRLKLDNIMRRKGGYLDFYFNEYLGDFPWRKGDIKWLRNNLKNLKKSYAFEPMYEKFKNKVCDKYIQKEECRLVKYIND